MLLVFDQFNDVLVAHWLVRLLLVIGDLVCLFLVVVLVLVLVVILLLVALVLMVLVVVVSWVVVGFDDLVAVVAFLLLV